MVIILIIDVSITFNIFILSIFVIVLFMILFVIFMVSTFINIDIIITIVTDGAMAFVS